MENAEFKDRRNSERIVVSSSVRYFDPHAYRWGLAEIRNIGVEGVGLLMEAKLNPGFTLEMWIIIPNSDQFFHARGDIVWSEQVEDSKYNIGIKLREKNSPDALRVLRASKMQ